MPLWQFVTLSKVTWVNKICTTLRINKTKYTVARTNKTKHIVRITQDRILCQNQTKHVVVRNIKTCCCQNQAKCTVVRIKQSMYYCEKQLNKTCNCENQSQHTSVWANQTKEVLLPQSKQNDHYYHAIPMQETSSFPVPNDTL